MHYWNLHIYKMAEKWCVDSDVKMTFLLTDIAFVVEV